MEYYDDSYNGPRQGNMGTGTMGMGGFPPTQYPLPTMQIPQMSQTGLPTLPTGIPAGGLVGPVPTGQMPTGMDFGTPMTTESVLFVAGFLKTQIGKNMRVEFLIGTGGPLVDRIGTLVAVGTSYILLRPYGSREIIMCDLYSIKFVTVFPDSTMNTLQY